MTDSTILGPAGCKLNVGEPTDSDGVRELGYRVVDIIAEELADPTRRPANPPPTEPAAMEALFGGPLPECGVSPEELLMLVRDNVLPSAPNYNHPRLISYVSSSTTPLPGLIEALVGTLRLFPYTWAMTPACSHIETTVVRWLGELIGFSDQAAGYMTTGGSWANLMGLAAARTSRAGWDVIHAGLTAGPELTMYVSEQGHSCLDQCIRLMGLGSRQLRRIPVDSEFRIRLDRLEAMVKEDLNAAKRPICVIGNAGTTNTGAVDRLDALADIAARYEMWFHVDGAYGAFANMVPDVHPLFSGMERADSAVCDPHKWLNIPYEAGCILVKQWSDLSDTFALVPAYLEAGHEVQEHNHWRHGFELTRADRALKVWIALRQYGVAAYRDMVHSHLDLALYFAELIDESSDFELVVKPSLSVCCFRYVPQDLQLGTGEIEAYLNELNRRLELELIKDGRASVSGTTIHDKRVLRACIVNYRVTRSGVEEVLAVLRELGNTVHRSLMHA